MTENQKMIGELSEMSQTLESEIQRDENDQEYQAIADELAELEKISLAQNKKLEALRNSMGLMVLPENIKKSSSVTQESSIIRSSLKNKSLIQIPELSIRPRRRTAQV